MHEEIIQVEKKDNKIIQSKKQRHIRRSYNTRAPSRQFNDPIYAGLDVNQDNKQHQNWGPWIQSNQPVLKNSHSLHTNLRKIIPLSQQLQYKKINRKDNTNRQQINQFSSSIFLNRKTPSQNQLPEIKQRYRPTLIEFKLASTQLLTKKLTLKKQQTKHQIKSLQKDDNYFTKRNIEPVKITVSTVVYNYCTNYNLDDCLLNYNKKSDIIIEKSLKFKEKQKQKDKYKDKDKDKDKEKQKQTKQQMLLSKYEGLKAYWKKRNTTHTALGL